jgi:hypothetical protein
MKTPLEILKLKDPSGAEKFKAIISFQDAMADTSQSTKLIRIQEEYAKCIFQLRKLWKTVEANRKNMADSRLQWQLANSLHSFQQFVENEGYSFTNSGEALKRDAGISKSQLNYLRKFRVRYPIIDKVSPIINWSKYREIMDIRSAEMRGLCEKAVLSGEMKTDTDIREFKRKLRNKA